MKYKIEITEKAKIDLRGIYEYIAYNLLSPVNANNLLSRLESSIMSLDSMPLRFRLYDKEPWKSRGLRIMSVDNFVIFYIADKESTTVTIIRVMYGGRDIEKRLSENN